MSTQLPSSSPSPFDSLGFLHGVDVDALAQRLHGRPYDALWVYLEQRAHASMARALQSNFKDRAGSLAWYSRTPMVREAALLVRLNRDPEALAYLVACVDFLTQYKPKSPKGHLLHSCAELAMACDMVRGQLPAATLENFSEFMRDVAIPFIDPDPAVLGNLGSNIRWVMTAQTACCALLWGKSAGVANWTAVVDQGIRATQGYLAYGADAQGHSYEGTGYGQAVLRLMYPFVELLKMTGYANLYTTEPGLKAAVDAALQSMFPDGSFLTNDNDHGLVAASSMSYLLMTYRAYGDPAHLALWQAYQGPKHPIRPWGDQAPWIRKLIGTDATTDLAEPSLFLACLYWDAKADYPALQKLDLPTYQYAKGTGKAMLRTSWSKDATFYHLLGAGRSHMSQTHRHADAGHFSLFAHGEYLAIDTGRYNSDEDQHSVPLFEGQCFAKVAPGWGMDHHEGKLAPLVRHEPLTYCAADMAQIKGCYWATRHFLVVNHDQPANPGSPSPSSDQAYMVCVDDVNKNNDPFDLWWQLQAHPSCRLEIPQAQVPGASGVSEASGASGVGPHAELHGERARVDFHFASPMVPELEGSRSPSILLRQDVKEWQWPYGKDQAITGLLKHGVMLSSVRRPRLVAQVPGSHGVLLSVVSPRRQGEAALPVTSWQASRQVGVRIDLGPYVDTILAAPSHGWIDAPQLTAMTELLWYRQDKSGKIINQWSLRDTPIKWK